jgi:uncharacterized protein (TIGR02246 family)
MALILVIERKGARVSDESHSAMTEDERAIRQVIATWLSASAEGHTAKILTLMSDDVVFLGPGHPPFGKEKFAASQEGLKGHRIEAQSEVREVRVLGDWAYCWADLVVTLTPESGGDAVRRSGNTLSIFERRSDGRWVLARDANMLAVEKKDR